MQQQYEKLHKKLLYLPTRREKQRSAAVSRTSNEDIDENNQQRYGMKMNDQPDTKKQSWTIEGC